MLCILLHGGINKYSESQTGLSLLRPGCCSASAKRSSGTVSCRTHTSDRGWSSGTAPTQRQDQHQRTPAHEWNTPSGTLVSRPPRLWSVSNNLGRQQTTQAFIPALLPWIVLTGSRPSMASIQSLRSSSDSACMVITPGLWRKEDTAMNQVEGAWQGKP